MGTLIEESKQETSSGALLRNAIPEIIRFGRGVEGARLARFGLTITQFFMMSALDNKEECMMKELGAALDLSMGAITGIVDRLVKQRLVERFSAESDRRVVEARLTDKGRELFDTVRRDQLQALSEIAGEIKEEDMDVFLKVLNSLMSSMATWVKQNPVQDK